jgi:arginase family enzyme
VGERLARLKGNKVYVTYDIDFVDAASAPGVGSPEHFGPNSFEAVEALRAVQTLAADIVGFDLVEVSPIHDAAHLTTYLGAQLLFEMVSILPPTRKR